MKKAPEDGRRHAGSGEAGASATQTEREKREECAVKID